ncbi:Detected protein of confused Function [Hibiscus syriacus]|uniref:Detected protein of confused Function n=1 Tax=Hibiscus syriacus TaxID=106335 RepID=A0A6A3CFY4_HIBSY|nr:FT-interacting protein 3-like [Hibiscus syriacus]KAE8728205.1 Detected protein of confused Function [Hibiscus syriacus]
MSESNLDFSLKETKPNIGGGRVSGSEKLTSSFDLVEQLHFLYVKLVRAKDLPGSPCNPFVQVKVGNYKGTTKTVVDSPDPEWNQVFAFAKDRIQAVTFEITVMNKESFVGKIGFDIPDVPSRVPPDSPFAPQWYSLEDEHGRKGERGELMLAIWMGTQADEVFPDAWHSDAATVNGESISNTRSKVYISPRLWYLRVNIIQAQDLVSMNNNRVPEVYVKSMLGNMVLRSRFSPDKSLNPTWNEDLMFVVAEPFDDPLILSVVDKLGDNKEDVLGSCSVHLSKVEKRLMPIPVEAYWYNLEESANRNKLEVRFASRLHLRICLDGGYHVLDEPIYYSSDFRATSKLLWPPSIGVLELGILNASGLLPMKSKDGRGTTDAYCVAKYGPKWVRTRTIVDSFSPNWNEQYTWDIYDPCTVITIGVFDNCHLEGGSKTADSKDRRIGKVRIRLSTLNADRIYTLSYPLIVLEPNGVKKTGEIQLSVRFTCSSTWNLLQSYTQPLFPEMHYLLPLSVYQIESLRHQATHILSSRLHRAEPPLRREVVEYMLDVGSNVWSLRRGRANLERLLAAFNLLVEAWKSFDKIRKWKNPISTMTVHFLYSILILFPDKILPLAFLMCIVHGASQYRKRPRHPPHMDTKLSLVESVQTDDFDEEFDMFPTSKGDKVLKKRYDRLRSIAGRMMTIIGDLATQAERLNSMLSWRDPRATSMFMAFCVIACVTFHLVPCRLFALGFGFFAMRHPRFRINIPSLPQNFFKRLPARADSMI